MLTWWGSGCWQTFRDFVFVSCLKSWRALLRTGRKWKRGFAKKGPTKGCFLAPRQSEEYFGMFFWALIPFSLVHAIGMWFCKEAEGGFGLQWYRVTRVLHSGKLSQNTRSVLDSHLIKHIQCTGGEWKMNRTQIHGEIMIKEFTCICTGICKCCLKSLTGLQHDWHASTALPATSEPHLHNEEKFQSRNANATSLLYWAGTFVVSKELLESQLIKCSKDSNPLHFHKDFLSCCYALWCAPNVVIVSMRLSTISWGWGHGRCILSNAQSNTEASPPFPTSFLQLCPTFLRWAQGRGLALEDHPGKSKWPEREMRRGRKEGRRRSSAWEYICWLHLVFVRCTTKCSFYVVQV